MNSTHKINYRYHVLTIISLVFSVAVCQAAVINEIRIDQPGADTDEYFELYGSAGESLDNLSYLVIGDQSSNQGYIESVVDLSGYRIAADGFFLVAESGFSLHPNIDLTTSLNFENNDNVTHMLVRDFTGSLRDDIDTNNDGAIDNVLWSSIIDSVSVLATTSGGDLTYGLASVGPYNGTSPAHVYRSPDQFGTWLAGDTATGLTDSPRVLKQVAETVTVPEPSSFLLLMSGLLLPVIRKLSSAPTAA